MIILIAAVIGGGMAAGMYAAVSREIKDMNIKGLASNYSSFIYYTDDFGQVQELEQINSDSSRIWVDTTQISQYFKDAVVSIEDERFYQHHGVDIKRTAGATIKYVLAKIGIGESDYGGSTITQQVIKNITNDRENKATRKIKEMMRAIALENELTKDEILTMYLNIAFFANGCNGVEAASNMYFNKSAADVTLEEAASIVGITQFPSRYDPFVNPENNIQKRNIVLDKMLELGKITQEQHDAAAASDLVTSTAYRESMSQVSSYFVDQVINDVISDLQTQKGYSEDFATQQVYKGGLKIYSTVNMDIQNKMEEVFTNPDYFPYAGSGAQSAMVIIDPYTGEIKGIVGGLGEKTDIRGWNRATQAIRQPGSSIKPLSAYGPAIDTGKITESSIVTDEKITIGYDDWQPKNSYDGFYGDMTVMEAVARSANIPAVKVLDMVGLSSSFGYLQNKFHLSTLVEEDKNYSSLSLGGLTQGVTVEEMAAAYSVFANDGKYIPPHTYSQVTDSNGNVVLQNNPEPSQAISSASAYITADLLRGVIENRYGTARNAQLDNEDIAVYGKTGTTDDDFDKWFVGFTPYYVGAVWYGFDNPSSLSAAGITGNPSVTVWKAVMDLIHESLSEKELPKPANVVEVEVCAQSGMLATDWCEDTETAYFVDGTQPKAECDSSHPYRRKKSAEEMEEEQRENGETPPASTGLPSNSTPAAATPAASDDEGSGSDSSSSESGSGSNSSGLSGLSGTGGSGSGSSGYNSGSSGYNSGSSGYNSGSSGYNSSSSGYNSGSSGYNSGSSGYNSGSSGYNSSSSDYTSGSGTGSSDESSGYEGGELNSGGGDYDDSSDYETSSGDDASYDTEDNSGAEE